MIQHIKQYIKNTTKMKTLNYVFKKFLIVSTIFLGMVLVCGIDAAPKHIELFLIILVSFLAYVFFCIKFTTAEDWKFFKSHISYED